MADGVDATLKYVCGILAAGNAAQFTRAWLVDRAHRKEMAEREAALSLAKDQHRTDLLQVVPVITKALDFFKT